MDGWDLAMKRERGGCGVAHAWSLGSPQTLQPKALRTGNHGETAAGQEDSAAGMPATGPGGHQKARAGTRGHDRGGGVPPLEWRLLSILRLTVQNSAWHRASA